MAASEPSSAQEHAGGASHRATRAEKALPKRRLRVLLVGTALGVMRGRSPEERTIRGGHTELLASGTLLELDADVAELKAQLVAEESADDLHGDPARNVAVVFVHGLAPSLL